MLTREMMGIFCLGVVWLTALLVAGAAWQDLRDLRAIARRKRLCGTVEDGAEDGVLAEHHIERTGRAIDTSSPEVEFHDRAFESKIFGGRVKVGEESYSIEGPGEVWVSPKAITDAASCTDAASFDVAYALARKAKGYRHDVRVPVRKGDKVYVLGVVRGNAIVADNGPLVVATIDPRAFASRKSWALALFIPLELAACAGVTRLASSAPHFGRMSIVGAVLCLAFFLGVTPIAVSLRENARRPSIAWLRGTWARRQLAC